MSPPGESRRVLVVAATVAELCGREGLVCGVGPVEAAAATARALAVERADAVLHVGLAGARADAGIEPGALVVGSSACYEDLATSEELAPSTVRPDRRLLAAAARALGAEPLPIGTSARVGSVRACAVEAMEGFAVLRVCQLAGVPAVEVRAISNRLGEPRADWRTDVALDALARALPRLVAAVAATASPAR
ncbi:MAG TPA: hypothetical protein VFB26_03985 [Gaiellaceae bacterium]|nr:hypothetical protein [Gaiellaceae bacterium]